MTNYHGQIINRLTGGSRLNLLGWLNDSCLGSPVANGVRVSLPIKCFQFEEKKVWFLIHLSILNVVLVEHRLN